MKRIHTIGIGACAAATAVYVVRRAERAGRALGAKTYGMDSPVDDATLARKVESELAGAPKEQVSVEASEGVVQLRGEAGSEELIDALAARARSVEGVRQVENLLRPPGTPAPAHP